MTITALAPPILKTLPAARLVPLPEAVESLVASLRAAFGVEFSIYHGTGGELLHESEEQPLGDTGFRAELAKAVSGRTEPAFLGEAEPVLVLALPVDLGSDGVVAVAAFITRTLNENEALEEVAKLLDCTEAVASNWCNRQEVWSGRQLNALGKTFLNGFALSHENDRLKQEIEEISGNLANTYEEISVLYEVTQNLNLSSSDEELGQLALDWLRDVIPAQSLAIEYLPVTLGDDPSATRRTQPVMLSVGESQMPKLSLAALASQFQADSQTTAVVENDAPARISGWNLPQVRQIVMVPLAQGEQVYGWLAAFNHINDEEFGTVEASLMGSIAAILGIHGGNIDLYHQQTDFLSQMVRALTSAIDAKDPYTCGHSDRVARVSVCLGRQLGCDVATLNKLYMGGLLHDIGKIGIDDTVLRKPGRLTPAEFEHIKLHPELGYNILRDVKRLGDVLPIVMHHHESWDGNGYPHKLAGEDIPFLARICAVADAFDAMSSDRPYRKGMPDSKVNEIFRRGSGLQWDPLVVDAFFARRQDINDIAGKEREHLNLDVQQWI